MGGEEQNFDSVYSILLEILPLVDGGISSKVIDDSSISLTKTWSSSKIASELADAGFDVEIVTELPSVGDPHTIYFILKQDSSTGDVYDEWMYIDGNWEMVGNTQIDLSDYATIANVDASLALKADKTYVDSSLALKADKTYVDTSLANYATINYVDEQIEAVIGASNSDIEGKETEDFTFVQTLPVSGEEDQLVIIKGDNADTLYKYVLGEWVEQTPDANKLYFDVENEALYSYVTAQHQFAPVSLVNTIVVGSNLNSNADLKALKTPGVYSVVQRLHNATKGDYVKNWTLYVESVDYEEYDKSDSVYQRLVSNYTIQKRTWSATRASNDGWSSFSTYYAGEIKDSTTSKYYTWSSSKINSSLGEIDEKNESVKPIEEVSELPNASENKNKLFRLDNGEKDVYAAKLLSSETTTTNRLPDEQQIDKAYIWNAQEAAPVYYKGLFTINYNGSSFENYVWYNADINGDGDAVVYLSEVNATEINDATKIATLWTEDEWTIDLVNKVINIEYLNIEPLAYNSFYLQYPIPAIYNAPESAQIGNAWIEEGNGEVFYIYDGTYTSVEVDGETYSGYKWLDEVGSTYYMLSSKPASDIFYYTFDEGEGNVSYDSDVKLYVFDTEDDTYVDNTYIRIIYIPQLNASDSEQVGNAWIGSFYDIGEHSVYTGEQTTISIEGTDTLVYVWEDVDNNFTIYSTKNAASIYNRSKDSDSVHFYTDDSGIVELTFINGDLNQIETVKYQHTETTEEWGWEKVATEQYVDDAIATIDVPEYSAGEGIVIDSANTISCTVNAKDSEQIGVAYLEDDADEKIYYNGTEVTINALNGTFTGYAWLFEGESISDLDNVSVIKAEQIEDNTALFYYIGGTLSYVSGTTFSYDDNLSAHPLSWFVNQGYYYNCVIKQNSFTEKILSEVKGWKNEYSVIGVSGVVVNGTRESIVASGSTLIMWDNLALSIPSGKTVEVSVVLINTGNSALTPTISGNVQMMGDGNITIQPNELGLYRGTYISALSKWLVEAINQEVSGTVS